MRLRKYWVLDFESTYPSLVPRLLQNTNTCTRGEPGTVSHVTMNVIEIGPEFLEQNQATFNVWCV